MASDSDWHFINFNHCAEGYSEWPLAHLEMCICWVRAAPERLQPSRAHPYSSQVRECCPAGNLRADHSSRDWGRATGPTACIPSCCAVYVRRGVGNGGLDDMPESRGQKAHLPLLPICSLVLSDIPSAPLALLNILCRIPIPIFTAYGLTA